MTRAFVDTSALAKRYLAEPASAEFDAWFVQSAPIIVSLLTTVELSSTLHKCQRTGRVSATQLAEVEAVFARDVGDGCIDVLDLSPSAFHVARALLATHAADGLRTLDALQLAAAVEAGASTFVTSDHKLAAAAAASGLRVLVFGPEI